MNRKQKKRFLAVISLSVLLGAAAALVLYALKQNINLFYTPTEILQVHIEADQVLRLGGYVKQHSVHYDSHGDGVRFTVTDKFHDIDVNYHGVLPNLFREGQGVVVTGKLNDSRSLTASQVLAKHDEKYMPWTLKKGLDHAA